MEERFRTKTGKTYCYPHKFHYQLFVQGFYIYHTKLLYVQLVGGIICVY